MFQGSDTQVIMAVNPYPSVHFSNLINKLITKRFNLFLFSENK